MSQENVEVVRRGFDAFNVKDTAAFLDLWDPECEFFSVTGSQAEGRSYRGHQGLRRYLAEVSETWREIRFEPERMLEGKHDGFVVAVGCLRGEGRGSGVQVEQRIGIVYELRGRKMRYCRAYPEPREALEAVGLSE
jgi:ketosteroid isomerase-like protein